MWITTILQLLWQNIYYRMTHITGTIRENKKQFPGELKRIALNKGESAFIQHDDIAIMKYRHLKNSSSGKPKVVHLLSTAHWPAQGNTNKRDRDGTIIRKPTCIIDYNYKMGGVDMVDQQLDAIDVLRKSYKWYKKTFPETYDAVYTCITQILQDKRRGT